MPPALDSMHETVRMFPELSDRAALDPKIDTRPANKTRAIQIPPFSITLSSDAVHLPTKPRHLPLD